MASVAGAELRFGLGLTGGILAVSTLIFYLRSQLQHRESVALSQALGAMIARGPNTQLLTDDVGRILGSNRGTDMEGRDVTTLLDQEMADPTGFVRSLVHRARQQGQVGETLIWRTGRLKLHVALLGDAFFHWQIEKQAPAETIVPGAGVPRLPMLTVGQRDSILFMNAAARDILGARKLGLGDVFGATGPRTGEINTIETSDGVRQCLVAEFPLSAGRREIYLLPTSVPAMQGGAIQFDELPVPLLKVSVDGRVLMANRAARALVETHVGPRTNMSDLMEGLGRSISDWLAEAAAGHGEHHSEFLLLRRSDREVFVQVSLNRMIEGDDVSLIAVLSDATELKSLEAQFVQSQKMQAIGQLAGGVAHDFNNLLTAITGHCDLLLLRHSQGDPDFGDLVQINENANRAAALVGQLLAFSRKQNLMPEVLDLRDTLADLTHLLNRLVGERITLTLMHDPKLRSIRADKRQLEQVLMNLVVNARDAMPDGGEISIRTESIVLDHPLERDRATVPEGRYVGVKVTDQGTGIPPDKLQKVFEPFYTTKRTGEGTGLGLSTAYGIVKQTGGYIFVDSIESEGTTFTLLFPAHELYEQPVPKKPKPTEPSVEKQRGGVVLLVEDEAPVRSFASRALRLNGFTVLEAGSGEEALDVLDDQNLHVDLFVSDVVMPGLDGPAWVTRARESRPNTRVVFMSGYAEDSFSDKKARIDGSAFLPKPFSLKDLTRIVQLQFDAP
ncbi:hybrid sensor histidine kinase/response regulator [Shimia sediminis]|uniref:hybrid sensor histidine kinase/response regulator n=1 Tax=Shimia sediminis TaxID=2497945 RepID=UPI001F3F89C9|nr:ATP-binding protein [Shimia sediminis]